MTSAAVASGRPRLVPMAVPFALLFVLSGACGLVYQVVWSRLLTQVFGVTAFAVSTVLVSFMGGMALGAALLGRRADRTTRPLRMFALLEAGIGLYALVLPLLLFAADFVYEAAYGLAPFSGFFARSLLRFVLCLALLLVPTVFMGATLPALGQGLLRRRDAVGLGVGVLYFVNTLGAAVGTFVAGFVLIPALGLSRTTFLAVAGNALVASTAWLLERRTRGAADEVPERVAPEPIPEAEEPACSPPWWPLAVAFGSGMTALAFEVVWFRILVLAFGSTVYSFSAMLSNFLFGLAVGSAIGGPLADRVRRPARLLAITQAAVAVFALAGLLAVNRMPVAFLHLIQVFGLDFDGMNRTKMVLSFATLVPPALAFGATFPIAVRLWAGQESGAGGRIGRVYAWNTAGAIVGSFGAGFVLLPTIGSEWLLTGTVVAALLLAFGSVAAERGELKPGWAAAATVVLLAIALGVAFAPRWDRTRLGAGAYFEPRQYIDAEGGVSMTRVVADYTLTTFTEGYNDTIISFRTPRGKFITVNGSATASDQFEDMFSQRMLGHLPAALHPGPVRSAAIVGLGAGVTAGAIGLYEVDRLVAIELERGVFEASRFFEKENHSVLDNPVVDIRIDDGRNYLKITDERFDVISSAPNFPSLSGSGALYSKEFFELARDRLAEGGVMCQFAPIWRLHPSEVKTILASFADVFPHVRVFSTGLSMVLLGRREPFPPVDLDELTRRVSRPAVRDSLGEIGVRGPVELLSFFLFDEDRLREYVGDAPLNTDDRPRIEFFAPRALFSSTVGPNLAEVVEHRPPVEARRELLGVEPPYGSSYETLARAYDAVVEAEILLGEGKGREAMDLLVPVAESGHAYAAYLASTELAKSADGLRSAGRLPEAAALFGMALHFDRRNLEAAVGLGQVRLLEGKLDAAEAVLERARERYPESALVLTRLGLVRLARGDAAGAEVLFREAVSRQPLLADPHAMLGRVLLASGRVAEALPHLDRAWELGATTSSVAIDRVDARVAMGRAEEAFALAEDAARARPTDPNVFDALSRAAGAAGRTGVEESAAARAEALRGLPLGGPAAVDAPDPDAVAPEGEGGPGPGGDP